MEPTAYSNAVGSTTSHVRQHPSKIRSSRHFAFASQARYNPHSSLCLPAARPPTKLRPQFDAPFSAAAACSPGPPPSYHHLSADPMTSEVRLSTPTPQRSPAPRSVGGRCDPAARLLKERPPSQRAPARFTASAPPTAAEAEGAGRVVWNSSTAPGAPSRRQTSTLTRLQPDREQD
jgi:hypothetical protein